MQQFDRAETSIRVSASRLSARLQGKPNAGRSGLWIVDGEGLLALCLVKGGCLHFPLPVPWEAERVVAARDSAFAVARAGEEHGLFMFDARGARWVLCGSVDGECLLEGDNSGNLWVVEPSALRPVVPARASKGIELAFLPEDTSFGADGTIWILGGGRRFGGSFVWRRTPGDVSWFQLPAPAAAVRISGASDGTAWTINSRGDLWRLHPDGAGNFQECGMSPDCQNCLFSGDGRHRDVSVGADGTLWLLTRIDDDRDQVSIVKDFATKRVETVSHHSAIRSMAAVAFE